MQVPVNTLTTNAYSIFIIVMALVTSTTQRHSRHLIIIALFPQNESYPFSIRKVTPVLKTATDITYARTPGNYTIDVRYTNSGPDVALATHSAYTIYTNLARQGEEIGAFLGPMVDEVLEPLARQASIWGIPVLTAGGISNKFNKIEFFSTLLRLGFVGEQDMMFMVEDILHRYNWTRSKFLFSSSVGLSYGTNGACVQLSKVLKKRTEDIKEEGPDPNSEYADADKLVIDVADIGNDYGTTLEVEVGAEYAIVMVCASPDVVRSFMITAHRLGFTNGDYVFIVFDLYRTESALHRPWYRAHDLANNMEAKASFEYVLIIATRHPTGEEYSNVSQRIKQTAVRLYNDTSGKFELSDHLSALYDAMHIFLAAWIHVGGGGHGSGAVGGSVIEDIFLDSHKGITGDSINLDSSGARYTEYSIYQTSRNGDIQTGHFQVIFNYIAFEYRFVQLRTVDWFGFHNRVPPSKPVCPYNKNCEEGMHISVMIMVPVVVVSVVVITTIVVRRYRRGSTLKKLVWRVRWEDVTLEPSQEEKRRLELGRLSAPFTPPVLSPVTSFDHRFTEVGFVHSTRISIKFLRRKTFAIDINAMSELKTLTENRNENICKFVGVCLDLPYQSILTEYCAKGSLGDVLKNETIHLDWTFRFSLVTDIARALAFLHSSIFQSHGRLTTSNCVVDARFVLKITDFGLHFLRDDRLIDDEMTFDKYKNRLSIAPELLRRPKPPNGTKHGDIYSFAIICQEIIYRLGIFYMESENLTAKQKYYKVIQGVDPYLRPTLKSDDCSNVVFYDLIVRAWSEETLERPPFHRILETLENISHRSGTGSILDNLLQRMETYATDLETQVEARTAALMHEKHRTNDLLHLMLPPTVADQLIKGESVPPESYDLVTIFFSDIVGFTALSASCTPMDIIAMLNDLYTVFDSISDDHDVYKVETIGDAYMVVSGLPVRNGIQHAAEIAWMAIAIRTAVKQFRVCFRPEMELQLRIGLHTGPVCTGVVGNKMPRYCLFGHTVTMAAKYESKGLAQKIHISGETKELLDEIGGFDIARRGVIEMKHRGKVTTYWIVGSTTSRPPSSASDKRKKHEEVTGEHGVHSRSLRRQSAFHRHHRDSIFEASHSHSFSPQRSLRQSVERGSRRPSPTQDIVHTQGSGRRSASPQANELGLPSQTIQEDREDDVQPNMRSHLFKQRKSSAKDEITDTRPSHDKPTFDSHALPKRWQKSATEKHVHMDRLEELTLSNMMMMARDRLSQHAKSLKTYKTSPPDTHQPGTASAVPRGKEKDTRASAEPQDKEKDTTDVKKRLVHRKHRRSKHSKTTAHPTTSKKNVRVKHSTKVSPVKVVIRRPSSMKSEESSTKYKLSSTKEEWSSEKDKSSVSKADLTSAKSKSLSAKSSKKKWSKKVARRRSQAPTQIQDSHDVVKPPDPSEERKQTKNTQGFTEASPLTCLPKSDTRGLVETSHPTSSKSDAHEKTSEDEEERFHKLHIKAPRHSRLLLATDFACDNLAQPSSMFGKN